MKPDSTRPVHVPRIRYMVREHAAMQTMRGYPLCHKNQTDWLTDLEQGCADMQANPKIQPWQNTEISRRFDRLVRGFHTLAHCAADDAIGHPHPDHVNDAFAAIDLALKELHEFIGSNPLSVRFLPERAQMQTVLQSSMYSAMVQAARMAPTTHIQQAIRMRMAAQKNAVDGWLR